jgi:hypothetical protein
MYGMCIDSQYYIANNIGTLIVGNNGTFNVAAISISKSSVVDMNSLYSRSEMNLDRAGLSVAYKILHETKERIKNETF